MNKERQYEDAVNGFDEAYQNAVQVTLRFAGGFLETTGI